MKLVHLVPSDDVFILDRSLRDTILGFLLIYVNVIHHAFADLIRIRVEKLKHAEAEA